MAILTSVVFGLVPARQTARRDLVEPLRDSGKGTSGGARSGKLSGTLVVVEVALSLVLLAGAGLFAVPSSPRASKPSGCAAAHRSFCRRSSAAARRQSGRRSSPVESYCESSSWYDTIGDA